MIGMRLLSRSFLLVALLLFLVFSIFGIRNPYKLKTTFSYITRPVWDKLEYPNAPIINLATPELFQDQTPEYICRLHNNTQPRAQIPQLWGAMIFSHELDMLEVHLTELDPVVDRFVIMESDITYSGQPKPMYFKENRQRFAKWENKISYESFTGTRTEEFSYKPGDFGLETQQRSAMTQFLNRLRVPAGTLVIVSDVDEIPYAETMQMIKQCELPPILHLELIPFVYSFEFASGDMGSWHIQVHSWKPGDSYYKHSSKSTEDYVTEAGVHCSFCFRYISDFQFKMQAYSHSDRLGDHPEDLLRPERIQQAICEGLDIFDMLPEAYSFLDLFARWKGSVPGRKTARNAPKAVRANPMRFSYLLPGGCTREQQNPLSLRPKGQ